MTRLATILYEDQRGETKEFGPHALVVACVADRTQQDFWELRLRLDGRPMKGNAKVVQQAARVELIAPPGGDAARQRSDPESRRASQGHRRR